MMKKQSTLFPENEVTVISELDLKEAEKIAAQVKAAGKLAKCWKQPLECESPSRRLFFPLQDFFESPLVIRDKILAVDVSIVTQLKK
ncbi:MAG: hypothetical protein ABSE15_00170 [Candidatus Bathyarchaeia archaeon]|jgi:hypothetical protein